MMLGGERAMHDASIIHGTCSLRRPAHIQPFDIFRVFSTGMFPAQHDHVVLLLVTVRVPRQFVRCVPRAGSRDASIWACPRKVRETDATS